MSKLSFTVGELVESNPSRSGLDRLTKNLGVYSGLTVITLEDTEHSKATDILWALKLTGLRGRDEKMVAVKTAIYAAEQVAYLVEGPHAMACIKAAQNWVDDPSVAASSLALKAEKKAYAYRMRKGAAWWRKAPSTALRWVLQNPRADQAAWAVEQAAWAAWAAGGSGTSVVCHAVGAVGQAEAATRGTGAEGVSPRIKKYLIELLEEHEK